jgi:hypothetical protein
MPRFGFIINPIGWADASTSRAPTAWSRRRADLDADMISRKFFEVIVGYRRTRMLRVAG